MALMTCSLGHIHSSLKSAQDCLPPTLRQVKFLERMGKTVPATMTRKKASDWIGEIIAADRRAKATPLPPVAATSLAPVAAPAFRSVILSSGSGPLEAPVDKEDKLPISDLGIPSVMIQEARDGYYAVSPSDADDLTFIRLSTVKERRGSRNRFVGWKKVQTQHSDDLIDRAMISPEGEVAMLTVRINKKELAQLIMLILVDQRGAALRYGQRLGQCCSCGKTLTDERSRYYGIGPECEKRWPELISQVDEERGKFVSSGVI